MKIGFEILDDVVEQNGGKRIGHLSLQRPVAQDQDLLFVELAVCRHAVIPSAYRRRGGWIVSLKVLDHCLWGIKRREAASARLGFPRSAGPQRGKLQH